MRVLLWCVPWLAFGGCVEEHACTEIGCSDQASLTVRTARGEWESGDYSFEVVFDASSHSCAFTLPGDAPVGGAWTPLECTPRLDASLTPELKCIEQQSGNSSSQTCSVFEGRFYLQASTQGTPAEVRVVLERDGAPLLDETKALSYRTAQPNGPDCEPTCRHASVEFRVP